ncbi:MAG: Virulence factor Mce family protein [Solirubrobacterales bacterium]|jgi:virulence factor Mce-like protein|nr:Virulence factor Mce family protein [Solirubrobacterales bacterium]
MSGDKRGILPRFEVVPGEHRAHPLRNGLLFLALLGFVLFCGYTRNIPFVNNGGQVVKAEFSNAINASTGNIVRSRGVEVGEVTKIERDDDGEGAVLTMKLKKDAGIKVMKDARADLFWRTLLGRNMYVDLDPGTQAAGDLGDARIPVKRTSNQVELDQVLASYDSDGRKGVQTFMREFDTAFSDPDAPGASIEALAPAMTNAAGGLPALRGQAPGDDITTLVRTASRTLGALAADESRLAGLIDGADVTFSVTNARRQDIGAMLDQAPATLRETQTTMRRVRTTLDAVDPVASELRPGVREVDDAVRTTRPALRQLTKVLPSANPALRQLVPAMRDLKAATQVATPLMREAAPVLDRAGGTILPFLDEVDPDTKLKNHQAIGPFFSVLSSGSSSFDANGHAMRFQAGVGERSATNTLPCQTGIFDKNPPASDLAACQALTGALSGLFGGGLPGATARDVRTSGRVVEASRPRVLTGLPSLGSAPVGAASPSHPTKAAATVLDQVGDVLKGVLR